MPTPQHKIIRDFLANHSDPEIAASLLYQWGYFLALESNPAENKSKGVWGNFIQFSLAAIRRELSGAVGTISSHTTNELVRDYEVLLKLEKFPPSGIDI